METLQKVVYEKLKEINTMAEEGLIEMMTTEAMKEINVQKSFNTGKARKKTKNGKAAYVYASKSILDWEYDKFNSIEDAVRRALGYLDAYVICDGEIIKYDVIDENTAYYYNNNKKYIFKTA